MRAHGHLVAWIAAAAATLACAPMAAAQGCPTEAIPVPGAEQQVQACLSDLTTAGTRTSGHTDPSDWASLTPTSQRNPSGVPGLQIDGYMPDTSTSNINPNTGWTHDSQFVIRMPDEWNGKLVVTGAPGTRKQYASDPIISDWVLSKGYAYAGTDKGNGGVLFFRDGVNPGDAGVEWNTRVTELTIAAKEVIRKRYGRTPDRTYVTGISQGGYLTRWQLENRPDLYDGGVDWEGTLWQPKSPSIFSYLSAALRHYPKFRATGDQAAHDAMIEAGFAPGSEFLWEDHYGVYWDLTQRSYREEFDPEYDGPLLGGIPFCQPGVPNCDADYDYSKRLDTAGAAIARIQNTGKIGKPMITLHGTLDSLLPIAANGDIYRKLVEQAGTTDKHRYWVFENGNHVDGRFDLFPDRIKPLWPCWTVAFDQMTKWVETGAEPSRNQFVPDDRSTETDVANKCTVPQGPNVQGVGPLGEQIKRVIPRLSFTVKPRRDRTKPYRFKLSGRLLLPKGVKAAQACGSGTFFLRVSTTTRRASLRKNCTFSATLTVRKRPRTGRSVVRVLWAGNRALFPLRKATRRIAIG